MAFAQALENAPLPRIASINLCADQLVLALADPGQIATLSWLSADPEESMRAAEAARYPLNYGSAEEILRVRPDVVIAGQYTGGFTRALLERLGYEIVLIRAESSVDDIAWNLRVVGNALGQPARAEVQVAELQERIRRARERRPASRPAAVVVRPGGFTVGADMLAHELMTIAGVRNVAAEQGLDRWGSLSMETLVRSTPDLLVLSGYHDADPSLANAALGHPVLARLAARTPTVTMPAPLTACGLPESLAAAELLQAAAGRR